MGTILAGAAALAGGMFILTQNSDGKQGGILQWLQGIAQTFTGFVSNIFTQNDSKTGETQPAPSQLPDQQPDKTDSPEHNIPKTVQSEAKQAVEPIKVSKNIDLTNHVSLADTSQKDVYLSFDDGIMGKGRSGEHATEELLDVLKEHGAKATFFITTDTIDNPQKQALIKRMVREGHEVGVHSTNHDYNLRNQSDDAIRTDVKKSKAFLENIIQTEFPDYHVALFRPPGGFIHQRYQKILAEEGLAIAMWDVDTNDYDSAKWVGGNEVANQIRSGRSNVLMHNADLPKDDPRFPIVIERDKLLRGDGAELNIADKVKSFLPQLTSEGFTFNTISEGLKEDGMDEIASGTIIGSEATHGLVHSGTKTDPLGKQSQYSQVS